MRVMLCALGTKEEVNKFLCALMMTPDVPPPPQLEPPIGFAPHRGTAGSSSAYVGVPVAGARTSWQAELLPGGGGAAHGGNGAVSGGGGGSGVTAATMSG